MPDSVHKILIHGLLILENALLSHTCISHFVRWRDFKQKSSPSEYIKTIFKKSSQFFENATDNEQKSLFRNSSEFFRERKQF